MRIYLIGFMGSGKTSVGRQLARQLGRPFVDVDELIVQAAGRSIAQLFEQEGAAVFRQMEQEQLKATLRWEHPVVATGGGAPCFFDNMAWINHNGLSIYLKAPADLLATRLGVNREVRPLLQSLKADEIQEYIVQKLEERSPYYEQAHVVYQQVPQESPADVARAIAQQFHQITGH